MRRFTAASRPHIRSPPSRRAAYRTGVSSDNASSSRSSNGAPNRLTSAGSSIPNITRTITSRVSSRAASTIRIGRPCGHWSIAARVADSMIGT